MLLTIIQAQMESEFLRDEKNDSKLSGLQFLLYKLVQESFNFSYNFQGQYTLPVDANSPINHMNVIQ